MTTSAQIVSLIKQIRGTSSTLQRMKLLALAWRTLRGLSRTDQLAIAKEIGLSGAEQLVEKLADRSGISPSDLLAVLRQAEIDKHEPVHAVSEVLGELLGDAASAAPGDAVAPAAVANDGGGRPALRPLAPPAGEPFPEALEPAPMAAASTKLPPFSDPPGRNGPADRSLVQAMPLTQGAEGVDREHAPTAAGSRPSQPGKCFHEVKTVAEKALLADLAAAGSLLRRLRLLAHRIDEVGGLDSGEQQRLLELFPNGWSRRRAFNQLVRAGTPAKLDEALVLVAETMEGRSERLWALTTLQQLCRPELEEGRRLLEIAGDDQLLRRRLGLRLRRQTPQ